MEVQIVRYISREKTHIFSIRALLKEFSLARVEPSPVVLPTGRACFHQQILWTINVSQCFIIQKSYRINSRRQENLKVVETKPS